MARLSFSAEIGRCGDRLFAAQISDSDGELQHRMPFSLDIDWDEVMGSLRGIGYEGLLALDVGVETGASLDALAARLVAFKERFTPLLGA